MAEFDVERFKGKKMFNNYDGEIFEFENASYFTQFDNGYDPNEDPDFENMDVDTDDDTDEEYELDENEHEDIRICFRGEGLVLGPCEHMCCEYWRLKPIYPESKMDFSTFCNNMDAKGFNQAFLELEDHLEETGSPLNSFLKHHGESSGYGCTDQQCNYPNATVIIARARPAKAARGNGKAIRSTNKCGGKRLPAPKLAAPKRLIDGGMAGKRIKGHGCVIHFGENSSTCSKFFVYEEDDV